MLQFELEVVLVGVGTKTDLLYLDLGLVGLDFFLLLFLCVEEFPVIDDSAYRGVGFGADFHQIEFQFSGLRQSGAGLQNGRFDVVAHKAHGVDRDFLVDPMGIFLNDPATKAGPSSSYCDDCCV
jgi:hypothetical protein